MLEHTRQPNNHHTTLSLALSLLLEKANEKEKGKRKTQQKGEFRKES